MSDLRSMQELTVGVVADTHVPDRVNGLHPELIPSLRAAGVVQILHLGDVCVNRVLEELSQAAPVVTVRGNRDWLLNPLPPWTRMLTFQEVPVLAAHGQGGFFSYWFDKVLYVLSGYRFERYRRRLLGSSANARVYLFGHTHHPVNQVVDGRLYFNPGSACSNFAPIYPHPSFGLLHFSVTGQVRAEICPLAGWRLQRGRWDASPSDR